MGADITNSERGTSLHVVREHDGLPLELPFDGTNDYPSVGTPMAKLTQLPPSWAHIV